MLRNITQWFWFRNVDGGEDIQIEAMDIPRRFDLFCNQDGEWVGAKTVFSGEGSNDLSSYHDLCETLNQEKGK